MVDETQQSLFDRAKRDDVEHSSECLGVEFEDDVSRRTHFLGELSDYLEEEDRHGDGFPDGDEIDICKLSDPPYYTACPNPFVQRFIETHGKPDGPSQEYHREPFATDVREGKNSPVYKAHSYHTKVPHKAVMRYILHFTEPGDIVLDGFCGTGMTGVAAQLCGDRQSVEELGYKVLSDGTVLNDAGEPYSRIGVRRAILNDLSPAATFIASNFNRGDQLEKYSDSLERFKGRLSDIERELWTVSGDDGKQHKVAYIVWSDTLFCNDCSGEIIFWDAAVNHVTGKVSSDIPCPHCGANFRKRQLERSFVSVPSPEGDEVLEYPKLEPVLIGLTNAGGKSLQEVPLDSLRDGIIESHALAALPKDFPNPPMDAGWEMYRHGMGKHRVKKHCQLYIPSTAVTLQRIWDCIHDVPEFELQRKLLWAFTSIIFRSSKFNRRLPSGGGAPITGVLYIPSLIRQENPVRMLLRKLNEFSETLPLLPYVQDGFCLQTGDLGSFELPPNSIDYAFIDPPFGSNIFYADMNYLWESWLRVVTNRTPEAIVSDRALGVKKGLDDYGDLMRKAFVTVHKALKPGRWLTVEFHNSWNAVWNVIAESLQRSGFVVADVRTLDKKQKSFRQTTATGAVKQDLIISAYKPTDELEERFQMKVGTEDSAWEFVRNHLSYLPVFVGQNGRVEVVAERQMHVLFDRMVAFHIQRGIGIPLSANEFYSGMKQRFPERDGMFFLQDDAIQYDQRRMDFHEVEQLELFVSDEKSAIQWVRRQLGVKAMSFQELQPLYMKEAQQAWDNHEEPIELLRILEENFVRDDKEIWRIPDSNKEADLEQIRQRALLKEFGQYQSSTEKLKTVRSEALRAGFADCWEKGEYAAIIEMSKRVPDNLIQEDPAQLMYYDNAVMRTEE